MSEPNRERIVISSSDVNAAPTPPGGPAPERKEKAFGLANAAMLALVCIALAGLIVVAIRVVRLEREAAAAVAGQSPAPAATGVAGALAGTTNICLVIDRSGSMNGRPLQDAKDAAKDFVKSLSDDSNVAVVDFGSEIHVAIDLRKVGAPGASGAEAILKAIDSIECSGNTALWDAGIRAVRILSSSESGRDRVVILLTDGMNNESRNSVDDLIQQAKDNNVLIHTVALGNQIDSTTLERVAKETGAAYHHAQTAGQLRDIYHGIYQGLGQGTHK